jgi:DNA-binding winged helix-turn-helix (wHTH) protein
LTPRHCFEFGPFRADLLTHRLLRDGEVVPLQPKAFDTLVVLIQNRGRVVERAVLMKTLWPDSFVEEANLTQYVFTLRKALGEQPNGQPYIETVPRRGYFFAADAREIRDAVEAEIGVTLRALESESRPETPSHQPGASTQVPTAHWLTLAAIVVGLIAAGGLTWLRLRRSPVPTPDYVQLTNYADSATSPALSPDGRTLAFLRGENTFHGPAEVYVKLLSEGQPFQLTHDGADKMSPVFSPDGTRIAYTTVHRGSWDTWVVPIPGGTPQRLLPNASGLSWIAEHRLMFSEIGPGMYMRIATAAESRAEERDVYRPPPSELSMAHRSYLSPDRQSVLVAEMDPHGWMPCRLILFDTSSPGRQVGPRPGKCTSAAWSPDGRWMYFSADAGRGFHIWRQRFQSGDPEQITFGATEEEGIAVAPSGRSLITSVALNKVPSGCTIPPGTIRFRPKATPMRPLFLRMAARCTTWSDPARRVTSWLANYGQPMSAHPVARACSLAFGSPGTISRPMENRWSLRSGKPPTNLRSGWHDSMAAPRHDS